MKGRRVKRGFTLIELLVVIAIIGLLASVVIASLNTARGGAADARRIADAKQIQTALEMYRNQNGRYPLSDSWRAGSSACHGTYGSGNPGYGTNGYIPGLVPNFIGQLPEDPGGATSNRCYLYRTDSTGREYKFLIWNTMQNYNPTHPLADPGWGTGGGGTCNNPRNNSYSVFSDGGRCF